MREIEATELKALIGSQIGVSEWIPITQDLINRFADLSGDHQYIHVDPERAALSQFGSTIAHGFLILALLPRMASSAVDFSLKGVATKVNYGFNRIRFTAPVKVDTRIRMRIRLIDANEKRPGQWQLSYEVSVETDDSDRPALLAEWLGLQILE